MIQRGFMLVYQKSEWDTPVFLFPRTVSPVHAAKVLGLELCTDLTCLQERREVGCHVHPPEAELGPVQDYPNDDPKRAGLKFREFVTKGDDPITIPCHLWVPGKQPPAVYLREAAIVVAIKREA